MTADERRRKAIKAYYKAYREYNQLDTVREHMRVEMSGDTLIEIHRYYGDRKGKRVLRVTQEETESTEVSAEVAAYEQAADQLLYMIKARRESMEEIGRRPAAGIQEGGLKDGAGKKNTAGCGKGIRCNRGHHEPQGRAQGAGHVR